MKIQNKTYVILSIFTIIALFLVVFLIYPTLREIKNNSKEILLNKDKVVSIDAEIEELDNFKKNYKDYKPGLEKIDQLFIDSKNPVDFIKFLERISSDSNISSNVSLIPLAGDRNIDGLLVAVFQVSAKGNILNILKFIEKLEMGPYLIRVQNLTIKKLTQNNIKEGNAFDRLDASFLIEVVTK